MSKGSAGPTERGYIGVGLLGMGVVGTGVAEALSTQGSFLEESVGLPLKLQGILVRDAGRSRSSLVDASLITTEAKDILENPDVDIVIELMGGEDAALPAIRARWPTAAPLSRETRWSWPSMAPVCWRWHARRGQP